MNSQYSFTFSDEGGSLIEALAPIFSFPNMNLLPEKIVAELDRFVVGQSKAKRAVAVALRNRWRRLQVADPLRQEITPKNIVMIGPTSVGKTEIARRLARLANAPFIKVEATKFTEVGYVGRDVDSIIRDLIDLAIKNARGDEKKRLRNNVDDAVQRRILDVLLPGSGDSENASELNPTREILRKRLLTGELDEREIELDINAPAQQLEVMGPPGMEEMAEHIKSVFGSMNQSRQVQRKLKISEAKKILADEESANLVNEDEVRMRAVEAVEQNGIVFLDEIDKITARSDSHQSDVSRAGVQRDLLPLVEGTTVMTKYGPIKTDHILFIASGAFHLSRPSDLIPELQGRFPIRVELEALSVDDFVQILTATDACLTLQYQALLATEGVTLDYLPEGIREIAQIAFDVNDVNENIGARRLHTVMEKLLEDVSFNAIAGTQVSIDATYVKGHLGEIATNQDLSRYIL